MLLSAAMAASQNEGITAAVSPANPVVGVTEVSITGKASAQKKVTDTSTFPDATIHRFAFDVNATGTYRDGPFVLHQLGTYHDVLRDDATGASTAISYSGLGDFSVAVDHTGQTIVGGEQANFTVTFRSLSGFGGIVVPKVLNLPVAGGAAAQWSSVSVRVPPNGTASTTLTIQTLISTPPGTYSKIDLRGTSGSVTHAIPSGVTLKVIPPRANTITAAFSPTNPVVGVTGVRIRGVASPGEWVTDTSTFPDGSKHKFFIKATGAGTYTDGPFVLNELGTYHDFLQDGATSATTTISYHGLGDFSVAIDHASQTVMRGGEASFMVTFRSLHGFNANILPAVANLSQIRGAAALWSVRSVAVRSDDSTSARLTIKTLASTPPGTYTIAVTGTNGSLSHTVPAGVSLTVR